MTSLSHSCAALDYEGSDRINVLSEERLLASGHKFDALTLVLERFVRTIYYQLPAVVLALLLVGRLALDVEPTAIVDCQG